VSRSGYVDDDGEQWALICYRGAVASAIRGKRGQAFLREMLAALDALPEKRLIAHELVITGDSLWTDVIVGGDKLFTEDGKDCAIGDVCAIGAVGRLRGIDMTAIDPENADSVSSAFGINEKLAREIVFENDECGWRDTPEMRFERMRKWVVSNLRDGGEKA